MPLNSFFAYIIVLVGLNFISFKNNSEEKLYIGGGQMPSAANDANGFVHLVYGNDDTIFYSSSSDHGKSFSNSVVVAVMPKLAASHTRGPQIASTSNGITIIGCKSDGNIFSYRKLSDGHWHQGANVNDVDTTAKENLIALSGNGQTLFAVWLDLRNKHNQIYGASSKDGGKSWSKNIQVYASPDATVCECCKPSVVVKGNYVYVMFRNWLKGNRDLYLITSNDGGGTFGTAQKLGTGSWALNGCPMDGGGLALNGDHVQTIWNRKGKIFTCVPGNSELEIGEGRNCTIESVANKNVFAWTENGSIVCMLPHSKINLGKGETPVIKSLGEKQVLCIWENEERIYSRILDL